MCSSKMLWEAYRKVSTQVSILIDCNISLEPYVEKTLEGKSKIRKKRMQEWTSNIFHEEQLEHASNILSYIWHEFLQSTVVYI